MKGDLVVVVADGGIEQAIRGILSRHASLGIRPLKQVDCPKFRALDSGTYLRGSELAAAYLETHEHASIVFDLEWEGRPSDNPAILEQTVETSLAAQWGTRGRCVVINPELEAWVWSDSPHVATGLGWDTMPELKAWLIAGGLWNSCDSKPLDPKAAYLAAISEKRVQQSNATFRALAEKVGLQRCQDRSFQRLVNILQAWFRTPQPMHDP